MKIKKNHHIDIIREVAIYIEKKDLQISIDLMSTALKNRPKGGQLIRKFKEYSMYSTPSEHIEKSFENAFKYLDSNSTLFLDFITVSAELFEKNKVITKIKSDFLFTYELQNRVHNAETQIELLRTKFNMLHKALCYSDAFKVKEVDDYAAKLNPIEFFDKGSNDTLIVFGGMATKPSMPPKEFFASFSNKNINILFIKDFQQCWYQNGLVGISFDIDSTIHYLRNIIPSATKKLTVLGTSAGGYAAIRMGVSLKADRIIAFSPQTKIDKAIFNKFKSIDSRLNELSSAENINLDLNKFLSNERFQGQIEVFFGNKNKGDTKAAEYISEFANLNSYDTDNHNVASYLKSIDKLSLILDGI